MIRIDVDFNDVAADGRLKGFLTAADDRHLRKGDMVLAQDPLEDMHVIGTVESVDVESGQVWFKVDWRQLDRQTANRVDIQGRGLKVDRRSATRVSKAVHEATVSSIRVPA